MYIEQLLQPGSSGQTSANKITAAKQQTTASKIGGAGQRTFSNAASVEISDFGKELQKNAKREREKGVCQKELDSVTVSAQERQEKYKQISELEEKLNSGQLSEADKATIQEQIDKLKDDVKTPQERIDENINNLRQQQAKAKNPEAVLVYQQMIDECEQQKELLYEKMHGLERGALQEEADKAAEEMKEKLMNPEEEALGNKEIEYAKPLEEMKIDKILKDDEEENEEVNAQTGDRSKLSTSTASSSKAETTASGFDADHLENGSDECCKNFLLGS